MDKVSTYQKTIFVKRADIDEFDHVNNVIYVKWVQDIAKEHWQISASQEIVNQYKWVVVNHNIFYKKPLKIHQKVFIKTQVFDNAKGALWGRMVWIYDDSEVLMAEANTQWCLVDAQSFKPRRITDEIKSVFLAYD
ncbi:MAG: thioesterase [Flammeovirgaceae bacterium]|nr:thioesterase [Flammeovirgaceae bacterium]|tara:strand:+ start:2221 stop:2628 length:408 start_codon:yes stop_codon:yes gene_type:complete